MPLQNRVDPFGVIVRTHHRGAWMGNRGIIHNADTRSLHPTRRWTHKAWIICACAFKGRHRTVMGRGGYTELFFLDEATALSAGHRPCFECRRTDALEFKTAWARGHRCAPPRAAAIDAILHEQRRDGRDKRLHALPCPQDRLPDGVMIAQKSAAFVIRNRCAYRWTPGGYEPARIMDWQPALLLTPPATLAALAAGYRPQIDASARHA